jgi:energy-coupling factor transporter ATP-binding protein EcfA2
MMTFLFLISLLFLLAVAVMADAGEDSSLLSIHPSVKGPYYSDKLSIELGAKTMANPYALRAALGIDFGPNMTMVDLENQLAQIQQAKDAWMNENRFYGRQKLLDALKASINTGGKLVCLLGAKDSGKTTLAYHLKNTINQAGSYRKVVLIDMRNKPDFVSAFRQAVLKEINSTAPPTSFYKNVWNKAFSQVGPILALRDEKKDQILDSFELLKRKHGKLNNTFHDLLGVLGPNVTVIVDEAQNLFKTGEQQAVLELLHLLGNNTKSTHSRFSAVFITSEVTYPDKLLALNYDVRGITTFVYAGEVNMKDTTSLLHSWGFGLEATKVIIGAYGGHIYDIVRAVDAMCLGVEEFYLNVVFSLDEQLALVEVVNRVYSVVDESFAGLHDLLACLIRTGHATYNPENPVVSQFLSERSAYKSRILAQVAPGGIVIGHTKVHPQPRIEADLLPSGLTASTSFLQAYSYSALSKSVHELRCQPSVDSRHKTLLVIKSSYRMALAQIYWSKAMYQHASATRVLERIKGTTCAIS